MPYVEMYVDASDFIGDLSDEELIAELKDRGYLATKSDVPDYKPKLEKPQMQDIIWRYKNGYIEDAVYLLTQAYPELYGLEKYIKRS